jgi:hypothetical protein
MSIADQMASDAGTQAKFDPSQSYGTSPDILDRLKQTESGGNQYALNSQTKAMGAYQFTPETLVDMHKRGIRFDPLDPVQSRNAADYYVQQLTAQNGGDINKALATYGGFKTKDPTAYVQKINPQVAPPVPAQSGGIASQMQADAVTPTPAAPAIQQPAAASAEQPGILASVGAGAGKMFGSSILAVQQLAGAGLSKAGELVGSDTTKQVGDWLYNDAATGAKRLEAENAPYAAANPKANIGGQVVGAVASPVNKLVPGLGESGTLMSSAVKGGIQGGILNTLLSPATSDTDPFLVEKAKQAGIGMAGGVAGGVVGYGISAVLNKAIDAVRSGVTRLTSGAPADVAEQAVQKSLTDAGITSDAVIPEIYAGLKAQAEDAIRTGNPVDPAAMNRLMRSQTLPVPVPMLQGQITRNAMQFAKEQNLRGIQGVGEPITDVLTAQNKALVANLDAMGASSGQDLVTAAKPMIEALKASDAAQASAVTARYNAFRASTGKSLDVPLEGLAQDYAATLDRFGDAIPNAVKKQFNSLGLMSGTQQKVFSIENAENLIKTINANYDPSQLVPARALNDLRAAVQKSITEGAGSNAQGAQAAQLALQARQAAAARFAYLDATPGLRAATADVNPDKFIQNYILQGNEREIGNMMKALPADQVSSLQDSIMGYVRSRVTNRANAGNEIFSQAQMKQFVNDPNMSARLTQVLGPQKMGLLRQLNATAEDALYAPVASAVNRSNTAAAAANIVKSEVQGGALNKMLGVTKMVPGLSMPSSVAQQALQSSRATGLVNEALTPSVAVQQTGMTVPEMAGFGARAGAAALGSQRKPRQ